MSKILLVEDDDKFAEDLCLWLRREGHVVEVVKSGTEAVEWLKSFSYELIILDLLLPDLDGVSVCRLYRLSGGKAPVLMLTGLAKVDSKEMGLDSGADDYMVKPPDFRELSARLRALIRRSAGKSSSTVLRAGPICIHPASRKITRNSEEIDLTPKEYALLEFLLRHKNIVFSAEDLLDRVWHSETDASSHTVRVCIGRLRHKVFAGLDKPELRTIYGVGYVMETE